MNLIASKEVKDIRYLLGSVETAKDWYDQIKRIFSENKEYQIFAEPIFQSGENEIHWYTTLKGSILPFSKLSDNEKESTKTILNRQIENLLKTVKTYNDSTLNETITKCLEIPDTECIFLVKSDSTEYVILIQWGFVSDVAGNEKGSLEKTVKQEKPEIQKGMTFTLIDKEGNQRVAGETIEVEFQGKKLKLKSDKYGKATLADAQVGDKISIYITSETYKEYRAVFKYIAEKKVYLSKTESLDYSDEPIDCGTIIQSGGYGTTVLVINVRRMEGNFNFRYEMFDIPDELLIYNGLPDEMSPTNLIYQTNGPVAGSKTCTVPFHSKNNFLTLKVIGYDDRTKWEFESFCPEN